MAVIRKRNRLVSFRLSEQEYEALQSLTITEGARSISDFARGALCEVLGGVGGGEGLRSLQNTQQRSAPIQNQNGAVPMNSALEQLVATMGELSRVINRLSTLVEGSPSSASASRVSEREVLVK